MELILVKRTRQGHRRLHLGVLASWSIAGALIAAVLTAYHVGVASVPPPADPRPDLYAAAWEKMVAEQRAEVQSAINYSEENLNALALRLGQLQSQLIRLDALGERLVDVAKLDAEEFGFGQPPAVGGVVSPAEGTSYSVPDFVAELETLSRELKDRSAKLQAVEGTFVQRRLQSEVKPTGRPVKQGWVSSYFGHRADPFTGQRTLHQGIDFAGRRDSEIIAVAAGVVIYSGKRYGLGNVVEISHGNGYTTLYAHNNKLLVKLG
ncbi:MAG: M23 family metallopeptidase, partial [Gammaproteobacteria bacterium]|nr:M23 family metallopeptidase [Gammaproteobacteria bacterium]